MCGCVCVGGGGGGWGGGGGGGGGGREGGGGGGGEGWRVRVRGVVKPANTSCSPESQQQTHDETAAMCLRCPMTLGVTGLSLLPLSPS